MGFKNVMEMSHRPTDLTGKTVVLQVKDCFGTTSVKSPTIVVSSQQAHLIAKGEKKSFGSGTQVVRII